MKIKYELNVHGGDSLVGVANLKACPFCGEEDGLELANTHTASCWVECPCGAEMHGRAYYLANTQQDEECFRAAARDAARNWNKRKP